MNRTLTALSIVRIFDPVVAIADHVLSAPMTLNLPMESVQSSLNFANLTKEKEKKYNEKCERTTHVYARMILIHLKM